MNTLFVFLVSKVRYEVYDSRLQRFCEFLLRTLFKARYALWRENQALQYKIRSLEQDVGSMLRKEEATIARWITQHTGDLLPSQILPRLRNVYSEDESDEPQITEDLSDDEFVEAFFGPTTSHTEREGSPV